MQRELAASGLSPEEILAKTLLLQKAMAGDNSPAFINKTLKNALNVASLNKEDLVKVSWSSHSISNWFSHFVEKCYAGALGALSWVFFDIKEL